MRYTLVTGASSGIGRELAIYLSKDRNVILHGRNEKKLYETREKCNGDSRVLIWNYDLSEYKGLEKSFVQWMAEQGNVEIASFVHCAGVLKMLPLRSVSAEAMEAVFAVNTFAPELLVKVLSSRKVNEDCLESVVFISSNISNRGARAFSLYGASKASLDGVMRNLAVELAPRIRVNSVLPGAMKTDMTADMYKNAGFKEKMEENYPLGAGIPSDIVSLVEFLLSSKARWITGQQFVVDGGRTIDISE